MQQHTFPQFAPNRIDRDRMIIRGVTAPELYALFSASAPVAIIALVLMTLFSSFFAGVVAGIFSGVVFLVVSVLFTASLKRGQVPHYLPHRITILKDAASLGRAPFIYRDSHYRSIR